MKSVFAPLCLLLLVLLAGVFRPGDVEAQVTVSLVSADHSAQLGHALPVALRIEHQPGWHTYWINAGTGYPTSVEWTLPEGWSAGPIEWPTPYEIKDAQGDTTGYGFSGTTYLPMTLSIPASAKAARATLQANVKWLMCADICIPGVQQVSLEVPVTTAASQPDVAVRAQIAQMSMPRLVPDLHVTAVRNDERVTLQLDGPSDFKAAHFFSADGFIAYDLPQMGSAHGNLARIELPIAGDAEPGTTKLVGVLAYTDASGEYNGIKIDIDLTDEAAAGGGKARQQSNNVVSERAVTAGAASTSLLVTLVLALLGGLILNLMPCVFPVLGIKIMGFVNQSGSDRRQVTLHGLLFTLGVLLSFWGLATVLAILRSGGTQLGWGFQLQSPLFVFGLAVVMLIFALSLAGMFEFGMSVMGVGSSLQTKSGYTGTFFSGVLATVVATPCSAPFLAPALGATLALPTAQTFLVFTAIALGLSLPSLLLSIFPGALRLLPKPGRWMETFKQAMAFPMIATVAYLIWVLAGQLSDNGLLMVLFGLTLVAMAVWLYGRYARPENSAGRQRFGYVGGVVLLIIGLSIGWPRTAAPTDIVWEPWSVQRVAQLHSEGRAIYVDFTARWCATCQANKKVVFSSEQVKRYFQEHKVATLKADWTNRDDAITAELARWNRKAIPFNLVYTTKGTAPRVLPEILTPDIVLRAFGPG